KPTCVGEVRCCHDLACFYLRFFFSSRRRHTRFSRDWSSDVCSSDLVDWGCLRNPKRDMAWVALAGPASNLVMAIIWAISLRLLVEAGASATDFWARMAIAGVQVNLILMALNLIPLPPLDGGRIVTSILPNRLAYQYSRIEPYGIVILVVLMMTGALWFLLEPFLFFGRSVIKWFL